MLQSYINPSVFKPKITSQSARGITAKNETDWSGGRSVVFVSYDIPSRYEEIEIDRTDVVSEPSGYSLEEIEKTRIDFKTNSVNLRKYPKMTEEDWK